MWNEQDALKLREFLASPTGLNLIQEFKATEPEISGTSIEERAMSATAYDQWKTNKEFIEKMRDFKQESPEKDNFVDTSKL